VVRCDFVGTQNRGREAEKKMASMNNIFTPVPLTAGNRNPTIYFPRRRPNSVSFVANSPESPSPPEIELEFIGVSFQSSFTYFHSLLVEMKMR